MFQIKDDLLDYSLNDIGKPVFQDLKEGKVTYPFFFAYKNAIKNIRKTLSNSLGDKKTNVKDILKLIQAHGINKTEDLIKKFHKNAIISAKKIDNQDSKRNDRISSVSLPKENDIYTAK